jgi:hypothetical protein
MRRMSFLRVACPTLAALTLLWHLLFVREHPMAQAGIVPIGALVLPYVVFGGLIVHAGRRRALFGREADAYAKHIAELDDATPPSL